MTSPRPRQNTRLWRYEAVRLTAQRLAPDVSVPPALEADEPHLFAPLAGEEVDAVHEAHPVAPRAHQERMGSRAVGVEADTAEEVAVRDAGRSDDHLARGEVVRPE